MRRELPAWKGLAMMTWLTGVLWLDRAGGGGGLWQQRTLGLVTWLVLLAALSRVSPVVRAQTVVVVAFATAVEYVFSPTLEVYTYRFDNVPAFVPPGHGLVYLSAFALGHAALVERHRRAVMWLVLGVGGAWAAYGVLATDRTDALGAFWYACLVSFMLLGPSQAVYVGAFVAVSWLELAGTHLGTWVWGTHDPTGRVPIGNPPSGAAGGYGWFDLAGLLLAPRLVRLCGRVTALREVAPPVADVR
jgi:FtsH-binding integral membrane protein